MNQQVSISKLNSGLRSLASVILLVSVSAHSAPTVTSPANTPVTPPTAATQTDSTQPALNADTTQMPLGSAAPATNTLAAQMQPSDNALSDANQELLSRNAQLQRQVNDLQTQANVLVYESKGQLFLYGAFTVLISLLVGIFISWLVFVRRERW